MTQKDHRLDKLGLFILAGAGIGGLIALGGGVLMWGIPSAGEGAEGLLNVIATGLLLFSREIVGAIRAAWTDQQVGLMSDKLHSSKPVPPGQPAGTPEDPLRVAGAAPGATPVETTPAAEEQSLSWRSGVDDEPRS